MRFLGIDPSLNSLGWAIVDSCNYTYVASGTLCTNPAESLPVRLSKLSNKISQYIKTYNPDVMALESVFLNKDLQAVFKLSYVRGVIMSLVGNCQMQFKEMSATCIKKSVTGNGRASKDLIKKMVRNVVNIPNNVKIGSFDEADAIAIAYSAIIALSTQQQESNLEK